MGSREKSVRLTAVGLCRDLDQKDETGEVALIGGFVRDRIRYIKDIVFCETIQTPAVTLEIAAGDCDDKATLLAALLMSVGYPCQFIACDQGQGWAHVWTQALIGDKWIDLETTEAVPVGAPSRYLKPGDRRLIWPIIAHD